MHADVSWGGNYFGIVDWSGKDPQISPENGAEFSRLGVLEREQIREKLTIQHPTEKHMHDLNYVTLWHEPTFQAHSTRMSMSSARASSTAPPAALGRVP